MSAFRSIAFAALIFFVSFFYQEKKEKTISYFTD